MKKQIGILLLVFIAAVGLSSAVAAAPMPGPAKGPTVGYGVHHSWIYINTITIDDSLLPGVKAIYFVQTNKRYPSPPYFKLRYHRDHKTIIDIYLRR